MIRLHASPMNRAAARFPVAVSLCLMAGAASATGASTFRDTGPAWQSAWNDGRADDVNSLFAADAVFAHATGELVTGRPAISSLMQAALAANKPHIAMTPLSEGQGGDGAWVSGTYTETIMPRNGATIRRVHGSYLLVLARGTVGEWLIERMMWSDER